MASRKPPSAWRAISSREVLDVLGVIASELLFEIIDIVIERDPAAALLFVQRLAERGTSYPQFIHDLLRHLRQIFLVQYLDDVSDDPATLLALSQNLEIDEQLLDRLTRQAHQLTGRELLRLIDLLGRAQTEIRGGLDPRLQLEMALVRAAHPEVDHSPDALEERLRRLETGSVTVSAGADRADCGHPARSRRAPPSSPAAWPRPSAAQTTPGGARSGRGAAAAGDRRAAATDRDDHRGAVPVADDARETPAEQAPAADAARPPPCAGAHADASPRALLRSLRADADDPAAAWSPRAAPPASSAPGSSSCSRPKPRASVCTP